jgi:EPS-associated MarR family transcriptional regulator
MRTRLRALRRAVACSRVNPLAVPSEIQPKLTNGRLKSVARSMLTDEVRYRLLRVLEANPKMSQRDVARELGISLGKVNYCLKLLVEKGWIKAINFKNSKNKAAYMYLMTPRGFEEKAGVTLRFLHRKVREYEDLRADIKRIRQEVTRNRDQ